jgi:hypothetical protein
MEAGHERTKRKAPRAGERNAAKNWETKISQSPAFRIRREGTIDGKMPCGVLHAVQCSARLRKRALRLRLEVRRALSINRCRKNFVAMDSNIGKSRAKATLRFMNKSGLAALNRVPLTK